MVDWSPVAILPNSSAKEVVDGDVVALTSCSDPRIRPFCAANPAFMRFVRRFTDAFRVHLNPVILIVRDDVRDELSRGHALRSFRDLVALCVVPYARSLGLVYRTGHRIMYSNSFWKAAQASKGLTLDQLYEACQLLGGQRDRDERKNGSKICPGAPSISRDVEFRLTQITDAVVVSAEVSPAGVINVISHCWQACLALLGKGLMCRGYVNRGLIFQTDTEVFGPGHTDVVGREKQVSFFKTTADEIGTPFIQIDDDVAAYVAAQPDACVKEMFGRMTVSDGGMTAVFPIKRISAKFIVAGLDRTPFDPDKEKANNDRVRRRIIDHKERVRSLVDEKNPGVMSKATHYLRALDVQLEICDRTDKFIDGWTKQRPS